MMSAISYAAGPNSFPFKASYNWVSCGELTPPLTYVAETVYTVTDVDNYDCYDVTWLADFGSGLEEVDSVCPGYLAADIPKIYDATLSEGCIPNQVCDVFLKGGNRNYVSLPDWYQGDTCSDEYDVTASGYISTRKGNTAEISYIAIDNCTPNSTCAD